NNAPERNAFSYSNVSPLITRINRFVEDPMFQAVVDVEGGVSRNPGKFRRKTSPERFTAAFAIRHGFPYMFWPLNQTVFGLATSQPENKCLASIRTITGFPPMTEISGVPAYNPYLGEEWLRQAPCHLTRGTSAPISASGPGTCR
ncbi:hypothetical protein, partial [Pseudomonas amygdali]|uniref:hypothetical protein n=1 Tax=Pseudomonas amygdali TaxID=47877 RepID=UPI001958852B